MTKLSKMGLRKSVTSWKAHLNVEGRFPKINILQFHKHFIKFCSISWVFWMLYEILQENYMSYNEMLNPIYISCNFTKIFLYCWVPVHNTIYSFHELNCTLVTLIEAFSLEIEIKLTWPHVSRMHFLLMVFYQLVSLIRKRQYTSHLNQMILGVVENSMHL